MSDAALAGGPRRAEPIMPNRQLDRLMWAQAYEAMERAQRLHRQFFHRAHTTPCWEAPVDIFETEQELVVKADLPDIKPEELDIRVENDILTIRGERKFEKKVEEKNYLRVERTYGSFSRSFSLANTVKTEAIKAEYKNGVLTLTVPKREEAKPKQIKVDVEAPAVAAAAGK